MTDTPTEILIGVSIVGQNDQSYYLRYVIDIDQVKDMMIGKRPDPVDYPLDYMMWTERLERAQAYSRALGRDIGHKVLQTLTEMTG